MKNKGYIPPLTSEMHPGIFVEDLVGDKYGPDARFYYVSFGNSTDKTGAVWSYKNNKWGVRSHWRKMKTQFSNTGGYALVMISGYPIYIHHAVAESWFGVRPKGMDVRHLNGDCRDNRPINISYGTRSENNRDIVRHGRSKIGEIGKRIGHALGKTYGPQTAGENNAHCKLTDLQVDEIRKLAAQGIRHHIIAEQFKCARVTVQAIIARRIRKRPTPPKQIKAGLCVPVTQ